MFLNNPLTERQKQAIDSFESSPTSSSRSMENRSSTYVSSSPYKSRDDEKLQKNLALIEKVDEKTDQIDRLISDELRDTGPIRKEKELHQSMKELLAICT